jgi:hypothetical protein
MPFFGAWLFRASGRLSWTEPSLSGQATRGTAAAQHGVLAEYG